MAGEVRESVARDILRAVLDSNASPVRCNATLFWLMPPALYPMVPADCAIPLRDKPVKRALADAFPRMSTPLGSFAATLQWYQVQPTADFANDGALPQPEVLPYIARVLSAEQREVRMPQVQVKGIDDLFLADINVLERQKGASLDLRGAAKIVWKIEGYGRAEDYDFLSAGAFSHRRSALFFRILPSSVAPRVARIVIARGLGPLLRQEHKRAIRENAAAGKALCPILEYTRARSVGLARAVAIMREHVREIDRLFGLVETSAVRDRTGALLSHAISGQLAVIEHLFAVLRAFMNTNLLTEGNAPVALPETCKPGPADTARLRTPFAAFGLADQPFAEWSREAVAAGNLANARRFREEARTTLTALEAFALRPEVKSVDAGNVVRTLIFALVGIAVLLAGFLSIMTIGFDVQTLAKTGQTERDTTSEAESSEDTESSSAPLPGKAGRAWAVPDLRRGPAATTRTAASSPSSSSSSSAGQESE